MVGMDPRREPLDRIVIGEVERLAVEDPPAETADLGGGRRAGPAGASERLTAPAGPGPAIAARDRISLLTP